jgi:hypothetical protein
MKFQTKTVEINGESFTVKELSARQRKEALKLYNDKADPIDIQAHYIKMGVEKFKDSLTEDILDIPGSAFTELVEAVMEISGLTDKEDEVKNS